MELLREPIYNSKLKELAARHRLELHPVVIRELSEVEHEPRISADLRRQAGEAQNGRKPWGGRPAVPLSELYEDSLLCAPPDFDWEPYTARARVTLLSVAPKAGKSTLATHYAVAKATGGEWLGQQLTPGKVLWVGPDEHVGDVTSRFKNMSAPGDMITVWVGHDLTAAMIAAEARRCGAALVVIDTLTRVAGIQDENDNAAWTSWFNEALPIIRESDCVWFCIHHDRKSGGEFGEGIRGASAIFASVDVAISLRRVKEHTFRRVLRIEGSRYASAEDVVIELQPDGQYVCLGDPKKVRAEEDPDLRKVVGVLGDTGLTAREIEEQVGLGSSQVRRLLDKAVGLDWARRDGRGGPKDPYKWSRGSLAPEGTGSQPRPDGVDTPA
jgi:hypothetical protein